MQVAETSGEKHTDVTEQHECEPLLNKIKNCQQLDSYFSWLWVFFVQRYSFLIKIVVKGR